jgi:hypothetical protein
MALRGIFPGLFILTALVSTLWPVTLMGQSITRQMQTSSINLALSDLKSPHILKVKTSESSAQMTGKILFNGKFIQSLKTQVTQLNLSPLLRRGENVITVSGQYRPQNTTVTVELIGTKNQIRQEMSGAGVLNQEIVIEVE